MKQIATIVFALLCISSVNAQTNCVGVELGFGVDAGVPVSNDLKKYTNWGFGGDATLGYNFNTQMALLVRGGYMSFAVKDEYKRNNLTAIGDGFMRLCGRYNFAGPFYIEPQIGYSTFSSGKSHEVKPGSGFNYAVAAGAFLDHSKAFEASLRYEATASNNGIDFVGLRVSYSIKPGHY
jgi:hypothetical protein